MDEQVIEPCPFCEGEGLLHRVPWGWQVTCANCGAAPRSSSDVDEEGAVRIWNTRAAHSVMAGKVAELTEALVKAREFLVSAPLESGYCCCGSPVQGHGMGDGHSPVDSIQYAAGQEIERIDAVLESAKL